MEIQICSESDLAEMVQEYGFLPLFKNKIKGFSAEEHTPPEYWFAENVDGPWEWKGPVIRETGSAYGKFFAGKAGFISREWYPDFANWRRGGRDFEERYYDGLIRYEDKKVYDILTEYPSLLSRDWRRLTGVEKRGEFDAIVSRLQMLGYVITADFEYAVDKNGNVYGWGLARYERPEDFFGDDFTRRVYDFSPEESRERVLSHLAQICPNAAEEQIAGILRF